MPALPASDWPVVRICPRFLRGPQHRVSAAPDGHDSHGGARLPHLLLPGGARPKLPPVDPTRPPPLQPTGEGGHIVTPPVVGKKGD
eukprot:5983251-Pyramimonas_sp.AAC.1